MKYIRRKDDVIFSTNAEIEDIDIKEYKQVGDTIKELCDEFVYYDPKIQIEKYRYEYYHNLSEKEHDLKWLKEGMIIYGAIWTDKGLIYVAKINQEGDFVLL